MRRIGSAVLILLFCVVPVSAQPKPAASGSAPVPKTITSLLLSKGEECIDVATDADMKTWAAVVRTVRGSGEDAEYSFSVLTPSGRQGPYDRVGDLAVSPDGKTVIYTFENDTGTYVMNGNTVSVRFYAWAGPFRFAPDGKLLPYVANLEDLWFIVDGGKETMYSYVKDFGPAPDGKSMRFATVSGDGAFVTAGSLSMGPYPDLLDVAFSSDSKSALVAFTKTGNECWIDDGETVFGPYDGGFEGVKYIGNGSIPFAEASKRYGGTWYIIDGVEYGPFGNREWMGFAPDGKTWVLACADSDGTNAYIVTPFSKTGPFRKCSGPAFSSDGKSLGFAGADDMGFSIYVNGNRAAGPFPEASFIGFVPKTSSPVYTYRDGTGWFLQFGDRAMGPYEELDPGMVLLPADGKTVVFAYREKESWFVRNGAEKVGPSVTQYTVLDLSPDGKTVAQEVRPDFDTAWLYVGKDPYGPFDDVYDIRFSPDGSEWYAKVTLQEGGNVLLSKSGMTEPYDEIEDVTFGADGKLLFFRSIDMRDNRYSVRFGSESFGPYTRLVSESAPSGEWFTWESTPDGKYLSWEIYDDVYHFMVGHEGGASPGRFLKTSDGKAFGAVYLDGTKIVGVKF